MNKLSQEELVALIREGNVKAFDEFYKNTWRPLYQMAYRSTGCVDDAKDLVQNVFIGFWNNRKNIVVNRFHVSYLHTSLKNAIINHYRKDDVNRRRNEAVLNVEYTPAYTNEDYYIAKELARRIDNQVTLLPNKMQQVFVLSRYKNLSINEISETLNITPRTVKNQLSTALKILRAAIITCSGIFFYFFSK